MTRRLNVVLQGGVCLLGISMWLSGCGGGGGGGNKPTAPAFDLVKTGLRSISYGPMYLQSQSCIDTYEGACGTGFLTDDLAAPWAQPIWGGRGDLANIAGLGANAVRLYGNDPRFSKTAFLDEAASHGLQVIDGMSSYWYNGAAGPECAKGEADCHDTIRDAYGKNLANGFMEGESYHHAMTIFNVMNEPDFLGDEGHFNYLKAMVSAFDGILSAEKAAGVKPWSDGTLPRLTITWSFAKTALQKDVCNEKYFIKNPTTECGPGTIFMVQFYRVVMDPVGTVGYTPQNDLQSAFKSRWINAVNLFVNAAQIELQLLKPYRGLDFLKDFRLFCGEWHPEPQPSVKQLEVEMAALATPPGDRPFIGVSYFQYQVAYQKSGNERLFGMFALGEQIIAQTGYILGDAAKSHPVNCLKPSSTTPDTHSSITQVWNGTGAKSGMCQTGAGAEVVV